MTTAQGTEMDTITTDATENIFDMGCLVQLTIRMWDAVRKIDPKEFVGKDSNGNGGVDHDWLRATKKLIDPDSLKPIAKIANASRNWLSSISLPFPIKGMCFVPKDLISKVDFQLSEHRHQFNGEVSDFAEQYADLRRAARVYLGNLFNEMDYPADIRQKFSLGWRFLVIDIPTGKGGILTPEIYDREKEKFIDTMNEARELAVVSLRKEFSDMLSRITDRFSSGAGGKVKVFKNATVDSFFEYFQTFRERNIFRDAELTSMVERAQAILGDTKPEDYRNDESLREQTGKRMKEIGEQMEKLFLAPRRKIDMD